LGKIDLNLAPWSPGGLSRVYASLLSRYAGGGPGSLRPSFPSIRHRVSEGRTMQKCQNPPFGSIGKLNRSCQSHNRPISLHYYINGSHIKTFKSRKKQGNVGKYGGQPLTAPAIRRRPLLGLDQLRLVVVDGVLAFERALVVRLERGCASPPGCGRRSGRRARTGAHPHRGGSEGRGCSARSACRDDADLDQILGCASRASTHARAGVCPGTTHLSHTEFISSK